MGIKAIAGRIHAKIGSMRGGNIGSHSPQGDQSRKEEEKFGSSSRRNMLESASFAFAYVKRLGKRTKSLLDCVVSVETLGSDGMAQPEWAAGQSKPSSGDFPKSGQIEQVEAQAKDSFVCQVKERDESPGMGQDKQDFIVHLKSGEESDGGATGQHDEEHYRYYHQLPCEENQPTIEQGMVKRLASLLLPLFTGGLSNEEYLKIILMAKPHDGVEDSSGNLEEGDHMLDHSASQVSLATVDETDGTNASHQFKETADSCKLGVKQEEFKLSTQAPKEQDQTCLQTSLNSETQEVKRSKNKVSFKLPERDVPCKIESSDDIKTSNKALNPESSDTNEDTEDNIIPGRVSFAYSEDYCTPILEFEMRQLGCVLQ